MTLAHFVQFFVDAATDPFGPRAQQLRDIARVARAVFCGVRYVRGRLQPRAAAALPAPMPALPTGDQTVPVGQVRRTVVVRPARRRAQHCCCRR
ncbi:hypothetical protein ACIHEI_37180 [Kitasatospora sp. NPDC051984]|uniref:hypothetical protein n=1 Tax=Kitasatospora sp. NPDC051984 TaxID=3364059 RepID=UPI0037C9EA1A